jgi:hypothetical protein
MLLLPTQQCFASNFNYLCNVPKYQIMPSFQKVTVAHSICQGCLRLLWNHKVSSHSHETATGSYHEPDESSSDPPTLIILDH